MNDTTRRRRGGGFLDLINALLTLIVVAIVAAIGLVLFGAQQFYADRTGQAQTVFNVEPGSGLSLVATRLEAQGLISNRYIFQGMGMALRKQGDLKPGEFRLPADASMADILRTLTEGRPILYGLTVPEGYTSWQVLDRMRVSEVLSGDLPAPPPEGSILPQTYNFDRGTTRSAVLAQMQAAMRAEVERIWAGRAPGLPLKSPEEMVVLASIVEKETGLASERDRVAAVFVNRLRKNMRLQSDPTIIYGITRGEAPLGRGLRRSEIEQRTPYNTYQIDGLPPTPIANPGVDSLEAVANPAVTDDLYFVAAGAVPSDGHLFAATYAEHRRNVARYREVERQQRAAAAAAAAEREAEEAKDAIEAEQAREAGETVSR